MLMVYDVRWMMALRRHEDLRHTKLTVKLTVTYLAASIELGLRVLFGKFIHVCGTRNLIYKCGNPCEMKVSGCVKARVQYRSRNEEA